MERVYLDTSFFIGLLENQDNRQKEARKILAYEGANDRFTSELTINEFMVRVYDEHKNDSDCDERVQAIEVSIRSIARVVAISDEVHKESARLLSIRGEVFNHQPPKEPRDRKFRWDAIHLATAKVWNCQRVYAWDGPWAKLPDQIKTRVGAEIIAPARCPGLFSVGESRPEEPEAAEPGTEAEEGVQETSAAASPEPTSPPPPSEQSPAAPPASTSQPGPSLPSALPVAPEPQQQPEAGPPVLPPGAVAPQSRSAEQRTEKPEN